MSEQSARDPRTRRELIASGALLLAASSIGWLWYLFALSIDHSLDPVVSYVSEHSATDQPFHLLFRVADAAAALALIGAAALGVRAAANRAERVGWWALIVAGVATIADIAVPLDCAPSLSAQCAARQLEPGPLAHAATSMLVSAAFVVGVVVLSRAARHWRAGLSSIAAVVCVATVVTMIDALREVLVYPWPPVVGLAQRAQLFVLGVWLVAWGLSCLRRGASS